MDESPDSGILISDAEREQAISALDEHLATGRLRLAEHEERHAHAKVVRTRGEIEALFVDLPAPHPDLSQAAAPATVPADKHRVSTPSETLAGVGGMTLLLGIPAAIVLTILDGMWWTFFLAGGLTTVFFVLSDVVDRKHATRTAADQAAADQAPTADAAEPPVR